MAEYKERNLLYVLTGLTLVFIFTQFYLFVADYKVSDLIDSLVGTSIALQLLHPVILLPILGFISLQIAAYVLWIIWIRFVALACGEWLGLSKIVTMIAGITLWFFSSFSILEWNRYHFPDSLFARLLSRSHFLHQYGEILVMATLTVLLISTLLACLYSFWFKRYRYSSSIVLLSAIILMAPPFYSVTPISNATRPNIIIIGLDSLRPDFTGFYGSTLTHTSNIDYFLANSIAFSNSYTPLARTFPSWMTILTARYPKHHEARNNLIDTRAVSQHEMLSKRLQQSGYETIYATDEKRFSNITKQYGFDRVLGPNMGVDDFLLGGLSDFPLSNLLVNLPAGRFLFPFNYGNRAAAITYQPETFLQVIKSGLAHLSGKPVFLSVHLCLSHWPSKWADTGRPGSAYLATQYARSVNALDKQFGELMQLLKERGLLQNTWVVVLSDHGTALGLPYDRIISEETYQGDKKKMKVVAVNKLSALPHQSHKPVYTVNTSYGQGTNILSLKQNHTVLAFKRYGGNSDAHEVREFVSLIDVAPTLLDVLGISPLHQMDGISLNLYFSINYKTSPARAFFMETGDTMSEIETDHIYIEKVLKHEIGIYNIDAKTGLLTMNPLASLSINKNKQRAILWNDWMLAHYPASLYKKKVMPAYFVLVNVKTGWWTVELSSSFAKTAPLSFLRQQLNHFYENEI